MGNASGKSVGNESVGTTSSNATKSLLHFRPPRPDVISTLGWGTLTRPGCKELVSASVSMYMQDPLDGVTLREEHAALTLWQTDTQTLELSVCTANRVLVVQPLHAQLNYFFKPSVHTLVWNTIIDNSVIALLVCFANDTEEDTFKQTFSAAYMKLDKELPAGMHKWATAASDIDDADAEEDVDESMAYSEETPSASFPFSQSSASSDETFSAATPSGSAAPRVERNDNLAVGTLNNRTFVNRGQQLGVFKHDEHGLLSYIHKVPVIKDMEGVGFTPRSMLLHDQDTKALLLNPLVKNQVHEMDLETGKIIQEYNGGDVVTHIDALCPRQKYASRTGESTILGVNGNTLFTLDPRQSGKNKLAEHKQYQSNRLFQSAATTSSGDVVVGAADGGIYLYNNIGKVAKTYFPGIGDGITNVDVTADGKFVLATTTSYLLVIRTSVPGQAKSGFHQSIAASAEAPMKLQLDPSDIARLGISKVRFTAAHFNIGPDQEEYISTSTGPFIVTWNFRKIQAGQRFQYKIKRFDSDVVADNFLFGHKDKMVVALPDNIFVQQMTLK
jgi:hypothetical protein